MWIMTQHGFYSIVASREQKGFLIRSRELQDIENALDIIGDEDLHVVRTPQADYRFRLIVSKEQLQRFMQHILSHIDYPNFKERIHKKKDQKNKEEAYLAVWATMYQLQLDQK
jgi:hypothetical protein